MNPENPSDFNASYLVTRRISASGMHGADCARAIEGGLAACDGVVAVLSDPETGRTMVRYDNSRIGFERIVERLQELGYPLGNGRWTLLRATWFSYLDENARANAGAPGNACCSDPASIHARRSQR